MEEFRTLEAADLRALDWDGFVAHRDAFSDECLNPESAMTVDELRGYASTLRDEAERRRLHAETRAANAASICRGEGITIATSAPQTRTADDDCIEGDPLDSPEYRSAFLSYLNTGMATPQLLRAEGETTTTTTPTGTLTTDAPIAIPTTLSNRIIERLDDYGDIYASVSKTSLPGAIEYAIDDFDFVTHWVGEEEVSDVQKAERKSKISFGYHEFECRTQWSFLAGIVTMANFQSKFEPKMGKSIVKTLEQGIIRGSGTGQMLGIVNDPRVTHVIEMTEAQFKEWKSWHSLFDADIDPEYDDGNLLMSKGSWAKYIDTMADNNNAPVNYAYNPVSGKRTNILVGKQTKLVKPVILPDFDKAKAGDVVAIYGDMSNYCVNWQPGGHISVLRYPDYDKRKNKMLGYGVCDGKVIDPYGFILIKKKASA